MAKIWGQLENAQFENKTSDYTATVVGRVWWNSSTNKANMADGTNVRAFLRNDGYCVFGNSGTANDNIRFHRGAAGVLQFVTGSDVTAAGVLSTTLNQLSFRAENYTTGARPSFGNAGRVIFNTTTATIQYDTGSGWTDSGVGTNSVLDANIRQSAGLSLIGRSANSTGNVADVTAANDITAAARNGSTVLFTKLSWDYLSPTVLAKSANYTTTIADNYIKCTASGGAWTLTLHTPTYNQKMVLHRTDSTPANAITITGTINGVATWKMYTGDETLTLMYSTTDSEWKCLAHNCNTEWASAGTLTITGTTGNPTKGSTQTKDIVRWRRVGDSCHFRYIFVQSSASGSAAGTGDYLFAIPSSVGTVDTAKVDVYATVEGGGQFTNAYVVGTCFLADGSVQAYGGITVYDTSKVRAFWAEIGTTAGGSVNSAGFPLTNAAQVYTFDFIVPMTGWKA